MVFAVMLIIFVMWPFMITLLSPMAMNEKNKTLASLYTCIAISWPVIASIFFMICRIIYMQLSDILPPC